MATPLATPEALAAYLRRSLDEGSARQALEKASGAVRGACGWNVSKQSVSDYRLTAQPHARTWSVWRPASIWLPTLRLTSIETLTEDDVELVAGTDFDFEVWGQIYRARNSRWTGTVRGISVSYTHGYEPDDPLMDLVRGVTLSIAARVLDNPFGHIAETTGREQWQASPSQTSAALTDDDIKSLGPVTLDWLS